MNQILDTLKQNKKYTVIASIGLFISLIIITVSLASLFHITNSDIDENNPNPTRNNKTERLAKPSPTLFIENSEEYKKTTKAANKDSAQMFERDRLIGLMLKNLPYTGRYFTLTFSYKDNLYSLIIKRNVITEGNIEFNNFLKTHKIEDRNWIKNLKIIYE